jgi:hypothetical protein
MQGAKFKQFQAERGSVVLNREGRSCARRDVRWPGTASFSSAAQDMRQSISSALSKLTEQNKTEHNSHSNVEARFVFGCSSSSSRLPRLGAHTAFCYFFTLRCSARNPPHPLRGTHEAERVDGSNDGFLLQISFGCLCAQGRYSVESTRRQVAVLEHIRRSVRVTASSDPQAGQASQQHT